MSLRKRFIAATSGIAQRLPLETLIRATGQEFILPFYHIVSDGDCPHIKHLYPYKGTRAFEQDLDYLTAHYTPIAATDLPDVVAGKYRGKRIMLLSFDDGLREMYDIVAPILLRKGIPAVFFINTDFIDNRALMFRYAVSILKDKNIATPDLFKIRSTEQLNEVVKNKKAEVEATVHSFLTDYRPYMTTPQIQSLISQGFSIGAHSCSHPYYADLSFDQQLTETYQSLDILRDTFGITQRLFAFPFTDSGVSASFFDTIFSKDKVDFSFGGAGIKGDIHPHQLQRIPMEAGTANAEQILKSEYLYYLIRMPFNQNKIVRP